MPSSRGGPIKPGVRNMGYMESTSSIATATPDKVDVDRDKNVRDSLIGLRTTRTKNVYLSVIAMVIAIAVVIGIVIGVVLHRRSSTSEIKIFYKSAVVSDSVPCADAGYQILELGGSAVDASIATVLCMGVYNGQSSGIGGGMFMVIYNMDTGKAEAIDAREQAPSGATEDMYKDSETLSIFGGLAVAVPGELRGLEMAHKRHGKLPWSDLFQPAIRIAERGFPAGMHLARHLKNQRELVLNSTSLREVFVNPETEDVLQEGDPVKRTLLAKTLRAIAEKGADEFYLGETGKKFAKDVQNFGGIITAEDMANYKPILKNATVAPLSGGLSLYSVPPPASGLILGFILRVLDRFNMNETDLSTVDRSVTTYQRFVEALKYAYAYRSRLGDETFVDLKTVISQLTSETVVVETMNGISLDQTYEPGHYGAHFIKDDHGTAHMSVIGPNGDAVSVTTTINYWFGAGIRSQSTGVILNNEMDDFSTPNIINVYGFRPSESNFIRPGKRPQSSMCPAIIVDKKGEVKLAIGASGGSRIISAVALTIMRTLWFGKNIKDAIEDRRIHHQLDPKWIEYEPDFPQEILNKLEKIGHELKKAVSDTADVAGIKRRKDGTLMASYDPRKGGSVAGA